MKKNGLTVKIYGTRGSIPVAGSSFKKYGGNTTCLQIKSDCLPGNTALIVDSGSGFVAASQGLIEENIYNILLFYSHWHYDHTMGITLAPHTFNPKARMEIFGPKENGMNILRIFNQLISQPFFPVGFEKLRYRFRYHNFKNIGSEIVAIHPQGGISTLKYSAFEEAKNKGAQILFPQKKYFSINDCLIIRMYKTFHPEHTISYRFSEMPTGKNFVLLTDHENTNGTSFDLLKHLEGADLVIQDCQYSQARYPSQAGFGHGSTHYCVDLAAAAKIKKLGLIHHDPFSKDADIDKIMAEAKKYAKKIDQPELATNIFACRDFQTIEI